MSRVKRSRYACVHVTFLHKCARQPPLLFFFYKTWIDLDLYIPFFHLFFAPESLFAQFTSSVDHYLLQFLSSHVDYFFCIHAYTSTNTRILTQHLSNYYDDRIQAFVIFIHLFSSILFSPVFCSSLCDLCALKIVLNYLLI